MKKVSVLLPTNTNQTYDYLVPKEKEIDIGSFVSVSFRNKQMNGIVWFESGDEVDKAKLKTISEVYSGIKLKKNYIKFLDFYQKYNLIPLGKILRLVLPKDKILESIKILEKETTNNNLSSKTALSLTKAQKDASQELIKSVSLIIDPLEELIIIGFFFINEKVLKLIKLRVSLFKGR